MNEGPLLAEVSRCERAWAGHLAESPGSPRAFPLLRALSRRLRASRRLRREQDAAVLASVLVFRHRRAIRDFLVESAGRLRSAEKVRLLSGVLAASASIECLHREQEMLAFCARLLRVPRRTPGVVVEAGAYKGGGTAKLSLAAEAAGRGLVVFDTFAGLPTGLREVRLSGERMRAPAGALAGSLPEVRRAVGRFGCARVCRFYAGRIERTIGRLREPVAAAFVDLGPSDATVACLRAIYPLLVPGGTLLIHDADRAGIVELLAGRLWADTPRRSAPRVEALGGAKVVLVTKR